MQMYIGRVLVAVVLCLGGFSQQYDIFASAVRLPYRTLVLSEFRHVFDILQCKVPLSSPTTRAHIFDACQHTQKQHEEGRLFFVKDARHTLA